METRSLKALSFLYMQGNREGNRRETSSFPRAKTADTQNATKETLTDGVMDAIILDAVIRAGAAGRRWRQTPEVDDIEFRLHDCYSRLLAGRGGIDEYKTLVREWIAAGTVPADISAIAE